MCFICQLFPNLNPAGLVLRFFSTLQVGRGEMGENTSCLLGRGCRGCAVSRLLSRVLQWCTAAVVRCFASVVACVLVHTNQPYILTYGEWSLCPLSSVLCHLSLPVFFSTCTHTGAHINVHWCRSGMRKRRWVGNGRHRSVSGRGERQTGGEIFV